MRLRAPWARAFVHLCRSAARSAFEDSLAGASVDMLDEARCVRVHWAGYSFLDAILRLLAHAAESMPTARRFCLLSGSDYVACDIEAFEPVLACADVEYLRIDRCIDPRGTSAQERIFRHPWWHDNSVTNPRGNRSRILPLALDLIARCVPWKPPDGLPIHHGSAWWGLTRRAVTDVLSYLRLRPDVLRWARATFSPDETVFHSVLKALGYGPALQADMSGPDHIRRPEHQNLHGLHYIDWSLGGPSPRTLDASDHPAILESSALFVRKVDRIRSRELLDMLDSCTTGPPRSP